MNAPAVITKPRVVSLLLIAVVVVGVVAFAWVARTEPPNPSDASAPGAQPLIVDWRAVEVQPGYTVTRAFVGRVEARQESDLSFEIPGRITRADFNEGDTIAAGQVVAKLDTTLLDAQREELVAAREQAQAQLELADIRLKRVKRAHGRSAATDDELDEAQQNRLAAAADLSRTSAAVRSLQVQIDKSRLTSPFDGVVAAKHIDVGRVVAAGTPVLRLFEIDRPEVRLGVGGPLIDELAVGQKHDVYIDSQNMVGTVRAILPSRSRIGRDVDVIFELDGRLETIRRGDLARVEIQRFIEAPGHWLPVQALTEGVRGLWSVYRIEPTGTGPDQDRGHVLRPADVEILHPTSDRVYVRAALPAGTKVAWSGLHRVAPGMAVTLADSPRPAAEVTSAEASPSTPTPMPGVDTP